MSPGQRIRAAVVGVGHMGRIHARTYAKMPEFELVAVVDRDPVRAQAAAAEFGVPAYGAVEEVRDRVDAASVAVPASVHVEPAAALLERGISILVEKPLATTARECRRLAELAERRGCVLAVGHSERFNPAFNAIEGLGLRPKFMEFRRVCPFSFRAIDVGVVLDLMIHDLEIATHLTGAEPTAVEALGINVVGVHEDMADVRLVFADGCVARFSASRLAGQAERTMNLFTDDAFLSVDMLNRRVRIARKSPRLEALQSAADATARLSQLSPAELTVWTEIQPPDHEPVLLELREFAECIRGRGRPRVDGRRAGRAVGIAESVVQAVRRHAWDGRPDGRVGLFGPPVRAGNGCG